jgi:hypothetical protein
MDQGQTERKKDQPFLAKDRPSQAIECHEKLEMAYVLQEDKENVFTLQEEIV